MMQKAVDEIVYSKENEHKQHEEKLLPKENHMQQEHVIANEDESHEMPVPDSFDFQADEDPYMLHDSEQQEQYVDYEDYEYEYPETDKEMKMKMFD